MKKLFFTLLLVLLSTTVQAQHTKSIRLTAEDGTTVTLNLSRSLAIHFDSENLIATDGEQTLSISLDKVKMEYSTEANATGIETLEESIPYLKDGTIAFQGLGNGEQVCVYAADGRLLTRLPLDKNSKSINVSLSSLPKGTCIIRAGKHSMKYINR